LRRGNVIFGRYHLIRKVGQGGFGTVWKAEERVHGQKVATVAVKEVGSRVDLSEMKALASLDSPYILQYKATLEQNGVLYLVTEFADGGSALDLIAKHPRGLPKKRARVIVLDIARALVYLHGKGLIHRDVKLENILFVKGKARLGDVGTLKRSRMDIIWHTGTQTVEYAAPEMFRDKVGKPSDMYSLGISAYRLLTGHFPFSVKSDSAIARWHQKEHPQIPLNLPAFWQVFFERTLDKNPRRRLTAKEAVRILDVNETAQKQSRSKVSHQVIISNRSGRVVNITDTEIEQVLQAIRHVFFNAGSAEGLQTNEASRQIAKAMGFGRVSPNLKNVIGEGLRAAVRRGVLWRDNGTFHPRYRSIREYSTDELRRVLRASMGRAWWLQEEAVTYFARYLGFRKTGPALKGVLQAVIRNAIRAKAMERDKRDRQWVRWTR